MERPVIHVRAGSGVLGGAKPRKSRDDDRVRPGRIVDIRFGQVWLVSWQGRTQIEVM